MAAKRKSRYPAAAAEYCGREKICRGADVTTKDSPRHPRAIRSRPSCRCGACRRLSDFCSEGGRRSACTFEIAPMRSNTGSVRNISRLASAAAHASGFPVYECPCQNARVGSGDSKLSKMRCVSTVAPIGRKPPVIPFERHIKSGATICEFARKHFSSAAESCKHFVCDQQHIVLRAQLARMRCRNSTGCTIIPPAPCNSGSTITAAM